jgi:hypothetical protein
MERKQVKEQSDQAINIEDALFTAQNLLSFVAQYPLNLGKQSGKQTHLLRMLKRIFNVQVYKNDEQK